MPALTAHREAKLRHASDADGENDDGARNQSGEERDRDGHLPVCPKELNAHVTGVLSDEVDEGHAHDDSHGSGEPRG